MKTNIKSPSIYTHEGAVAKRVNPEQSLRRSVMSCLLWEKEFYEDGKAIADRLVALSAAVSLEVLSRIAIEARHEGNLRHVPLFLLCQLIKRGGPCVAETIEKVVSRVDEIPELISLYWKDGKRPLSKQLRKGLAASFHKFDEYQFAKYDRDGAVKLRDALFLCHPKPRGEEQVELFRRIAQRELTVPETWEVQLSGGADKKITFENLIRGGKLGYLALLRNLRNMVDAGCDEDLIRDAIVARKGGAHRVLPFRFTAAARACPRMEGPLDQALVESLADSPRLKGKTIVMVDVSRSMNEKLSAKSDLTRADAAATLASVINGNLRVFTFSEALIEVPSRIGMSGVDVILRSQPHQGTYLGTCIAEVNKQPHDRLIVITDEQSADRVPDPVVTRAYMINVASAKNGVGYGRWTHIDGFSESVIRFIHANEAL